MNFDYAFAWSIVPALLAATEVTIEVTFAAFAISIVGGLVLLTLRRSRHWPIAAAAGFLVEFIRNTPFLVQLFFLYFIGPQFGLNLSALQTGILALGLHYSCYLSEVYRAGLESVPAAQWEAAIALNLSRRQIYQYVIIPQALLPVIPVAGNFLIYMFKDTPFLAAISVTELMHVASKLGSEHFEYMEPITLCGIIFLGLSLISAAALRVVERRTGRAWR